jgi:hypothetical protein
VVERVSLEPAGPTGAPNGTLPIWLRLLALLLTAAEPLGLAWSVSGLVPTLGFRGAGVALLLAARVLVTGFGVAAGLAIFGRRPHAVRLAAAALVLLGASALVSLLAPILPTNLPPDLRAPVAVAVTIYYGAWLAYLRLSRRVRRLFE